MRARFLIITHTRTPAHSLSYSSFSLSLCRAPENFSLVAARGVAAKVYLLATERASVCVRVGVRAGAYIYIRVYILAHIYTRECVRVSGVRAGGAIFVSFYRFTRAGDDGSPPERVGVVPGWRR